MKTQPQDHNGGFSSDKLVEEYFAAIMERQRLEEGFYQTRDPELLAKLKTAKERIIAVMKELELIK